jgi:hypothetical protein
MGISEVVSPVSRKGSKVGSGPPISPGARSMPRGDSVPEQKVQRTRDAEPDPVPREIEKQDAEGEPVPTNIHIHNVRAEPDPEAKGDSLGAFSRLANRIMGRSRRAELGYRFRNFPTD